MRTLESCLALVCATTFFAGCDIPTEAPMVEQQWSIPIENTAISVEDLLPDGVTVAGQFFSVEVDPFDTEETLGGLCSTCVHGTTGPAPGFSGTFSGSQSLPPDVSSAILSGASVAVAVHNGLSFDPIAGGGSVVVTITDGPGGKSLGVATISTSMAPGSTTARAITLIEGPVGPSITAVAVVMSPGGQITTIDTSEKLTVSVDPVSVTLSSAQVNVVDRPVNIGPTELDLADVDSEITDRIQSGGMRLDITNPFGVAVTADLIISYPGGTLTRTINIPATAVSTTSVTYSGDDFRSFLGKEGVTLSGSGLASRTSGAANVRPGQQLILDATVDLTLIIG